MTSPQQDSIIRVIVDKIGVGPIWYLLKFIESRDSAPSDWSKNESFINNKMATIINSWSKLSRDGKLHLHQAALVKMLNMASPEFTVNDAVYPDKLNLDGYELNHSKQFLNSIRALLSGVKPSPGREGGTLNMREHQERVKRYMVSANPKSRYLSPYRGCLYYHDMGTGKTLTGAHSMVSFIHQYRLPRLESVAKAGRPYREFPYGKAFLMFYKRLMPTWLVELKRYLIEYYDLRGYFEKHYDLKHYLDHIPLGYQNPTAIQILNENIDESLTDQEIKEAILDEDGGLFTADLQDLIAEVFIADHFNIINCDPTPALPRRLRSYKLEHNMVLIDEAHNVVSFMYGALNPEKVGTGSKIGQEFYNWLMSARDTKIVFLSGTPIVNYPGELLLAANILRGKIPDDDTTHDLFDLDPTIINRVIYDGEFRVINPLTVMRRLSGLISRKPKELEYFPRTYWADNDVINKDVEQRVRLPIGTFRKVLIPMSHGQFDSYLVAKEQERRRMGRSSSADDSRTEGGASHTKSQGMCTFPLDNTLLYKIEPETTLDKKMDIFSPLTQEDEMPVAPDVEEDAPEDIVMETDVDAEVTSATEFRYKDNKDLCPKIAHIMRTILDDNNRELHFVYSRWVVYGVFHIEGYLQAAGYKPYLLGLSDNDKLPSNLDARIEEEIERLEAANASGKRFYIRYTDDYQSIVNGKQVASGKPIKNQIRMDTIKYIYNHPKNKYGDLIKVLVGSRKAEEGLDLKNVRQVYILEPHWNMVRPEQAMGRAIRFNSHEALDDHERYVKIDMLVSSLDGEQGEIYSNKVKTVNYNTTDQDIFQKALNKLDRNLKIQELISSAAIDCGLYDSTAITIDGKELTCSHLYSPLETGRSFEPNLKYELTDEEFMENRRLEPIKLEQITWEGRQLLKPVNFMKTKIRFSTEQHREVTEECDTIYFKSFCGDSEKNMNLILPALAYIKYQNQHLLLEYADDKGELPEFQIVS